MVKEGFLQFGFSKDIHLLEVEVVGLLRLLAEAEEPVCEEFGGNDVEWGYFLKSTVEDKDVLRHADVEKRSQNHDLEVVDHSPEVAEWLFS